MARASLLLLLALFAAGAGAQEPPPAPAPGKEPETEMVPAPEPPRELIVRTGRKDVRVRLVEPSAAEVVSGAWSGLVDPARLLAEAVVSDEKGVARVPLDEPTAALLLAGGEGLAPAVLSRDRPFLPGETVDLAPGPEAGLAGRIRDPKGEPVTDAEVLVLEEPPGNLLEAPPALLGFRAKTGPKGTFRLAGLPRGPFLLVVRAGDRGELLLENVWAVEEAVDLRLPRPGSLAGTVRVEPLGKPVAGAVVTLTPLPANPFREPREAKTDEEGRWRLDGLPEAGFRFEVRAPGLLDLTAREVVPRAGEERVDLDVTLRALGGLVGRVVTVATDPVAGARVFVSYPPTVTDFEPPDPYVPVAVTGEDGTFRVVDLPPEALLRIAIRAPGRAPVVLEDIAVPGGDPRELPPVILRKGARLRGRIVDAANPETGLAGVRVVAVPYDEDALTVLETGLSWRARAVETGEDGTFAIEGLDPGVYRVAAARPDRRPVASAPVAVEEAREGEAGVEVVVALSSGERLAGRALDMDSRPVGDVRIVVTPHTGGPERWETITAGDGTFAVTGLPPGAYDVVAAAPGYAETRRSAVGAGATVDVVLLAPGAVSGRVLGEEGAPVPPFSLAALRRARDDGVEERYEPVYLGRFRSPDGAFRVEGLAPGVYRLEVELAGGRTGAAEGVVVTAGGVAESVEIGTAEAGTLIGRVLVAGTGRAAEGALVAALSPGSDAPRATSLTDPDGLYRLGGLPAGPVTLVVEARDLAPFRREAVRVLAGLVQRLDDVVLTPGSALRVLVRGRGGDLLAGVALALERQDASGRVTTLTDPDGIAVFDLLREGSYRLWRVGEEGTASVWVVRVDEGEQAELTLDLTATVRLAGVVRRAGAAVAAASLEALLLDDRDDPRLARRVFRTSTDGDGRYVLPELPPGDYLLRVRGAEAAAPAHLVPATIPAAPDHTLDLELPKEGLRITVEDDVSGEPRPGVAIVVRRVRSGGRALVENLDEIVLRGRTSSGGLLTVGGLAPGRYRVEAFPADRGQAVAEVVVALGAGAVEVRLRIPTAGSVRGTVLDLRQETVPGAVVVVRDLTGRIVTSTDRVRVGSDGAFRLTGLAPGRYRIHAEAPGHARDTRFEVEILPGREADLRFRLAEEGRLRVTVYGPGGTLLRGAEVEVVDAFGHQTWPLREQPDLYRVFGEDWLTDGRGQVLVENLPSGVHVVRARYPGLRPFGTRVLVQSGVENAAVVVLLAE